MGLDYVLAMLRQPVVWQHFQKAILYSLTQHLQARVATLGDTPDADLESLPYCSGEERRWTYKSSNMSSHLYLKSGSGLEDSKLSLLRIRQEIALALWPSVLYYSIIVFLDQDYCRVKHRQA